MELLPYHEFGKEKYKTCGMEYTMTDAARITPETLQAFTRILRTAGIDVIHT